MSRKEGIVGYFGIGCGFSVEVISWSTECGRWTRGSSVDCKIWVVLCVCVRGGTCLDCGISERRMDPVIRSCAYADDV